MFYTTVAIILFVIRTRTPYARSLHIHLQFQNACLPFVICVLPFSFRKSLLGGSIELWLVDNQWSSDVTVA